MTSLASPAPSPATHAYGGRRIDPLFSLVLIYYWLVQFIGPTNPFGLADGQLYILFIGPMALYAIFMLLQMLLNRRPLDREVWVLVALLAIVSMASVLRTDRETIQTIGMMCLVIAGVFQQRVTISASLVNLLFLASIPIGFLFYLRGWSPYSVLPSFASITDLSWRVSVFPAIASGAFFALIVLFTNLFYRNALGRAFCLPLAAYFLLFSGLRTAIFAALLAGIYLIARRFGWMSSNFGRVAFFTLVVAFFSLSIFSSEQLAQLPILGNDFIRSLIVRDSAGFEATALGDQVFSAAIRGWMIEQHWNLIAENPLFGVGTFDFQQLNTGYEFFDKFSGGTEAYLTGLIARIGLPALLLLFAIFARRWPVIDGREDLARTVKLVLFLAMITYGSFIVPYDFIFLLMLIAVGNGYLDGRVRFAPRSGQIAGLPVQTA